LKSAISFCNLEDANLLLADLQRIVEEKKEDVWINVWNEVLTSTQQDLIETYGAVLNYDLK
jgi:hypothetical protein